MKKLISALIINVLSFLGFSQNILFVNDNDVNLANTAIVLNALDNSSYNTYTYWNLVDSTTVLSSSYMETFDLVIWYCSTDGVDLEIWDGSTAGNGEVINYILTGKPFWLIGLDILFAQYGGAPDNFSAGEFAYDHLGLASYDSQSYVDDANAGVENVTKTTFAPSYFPSLVEWEFATLWYVDGCTPLSGTNVLYEMGGDMAYPLLGEATMFHKKNADGNVMSTFFDPALIDVESNRINFLDASIQFLLAEYGLNIEKNDLTFNFQMYPNPTQNFTNISFFLENDSKVEFSVYSMSGSQVIVQDLGILYGGNQNITIDLSFLNSGVYFLIFQIDNQNYFEKIIKE